MIHAADGNIPIDMATGSDEEIEEERRLFYVALTRAKDFLEVVLPAEVLPEEVVDRRPAHDAAHRFLPDSGLDHFERVTLKPDPASRGLPPAATTAAASDIRKKIAAMWG